jgi:hypothetical protein
MIKITYWLIGDIKNGTILLANSLEKAKEIRGNADYQIKEVQVIFP